MNQTELNKSIISIENNDKVDSNNKRNKNVKKIKKKKIWRNYNYEKKNTNLLQNSIIFNNTQYKKITKQNQSKINNFKHNNISIRCSPSPPSIYLKINTNRITKKYSNKKKQIKIMDSNPTTRNKSKSMNKQLGINNSSNKIINTENIFSNNNNKININNNINKININNNHIINYNNNVLSNDDQKLNLNNNKKIIKKKIPIVKVKMNYK